MCLPPQILVSLAFNGLKFYQEQKQADEDKRQAIQNNIIAKNNRIAQEAREKFRIRKEVEAEKLAAAQVAAEAAEKRAAAIAAAETVGGKSVEALLADFYRQEGEYNAAVLKQIDNAVFASALNLEDNRNQEIANQMYVPNSQVLPSLAAAGLNVANDYLAYRTDQAMKKILQSETDEYFK